MITCFTPTGYIRLARSLMRFGMKRTEAMTLINLCARSNFDAYRTSPADARMGEIKGISFSLWDKGKPYHTEVQLYKSIKTLLENLGGVEGETASHLRALQNDISDRFWACYGVDIEDDCTTYALCSGALEPDREPLACLREDTSAAAEQDGAV